MKLAASAIASSRTGAGSVRLIALARLASGLPRYGQSPVSGSSRSRLVQHRRSRMDVSAYRHTARTDGSGSQAARPR